MPYEYWEPIAYEVDFSDLQKTLNGIFDGYEKKSKLPNLLNANNLAIKDVRFSSPATIVFWNDGTKTVVKAQGGEEYDKEKGLMACIIKRITGNTGAYNEILKKWAKED